MRSESDSGLRRLVLGVVATLSLLAHPVSAGEAKKGVVIIAPKRFHEALKDFVAHKTTLMPTELVSLQEILMSSPGVDDPERLKRFLFTAWKERNAGYALLVGDADVLPVRYMVLDRATPEAFDYAFYPSDLYYADLAKKDGKFDDWNGRKDGFHAGYFGEVRGEKNKDDPINYDAIDYRPDIAVGRWPVSTEEEVRRVAKKTMDFERRSLAGNGPGVRKAAYFSVGGWVDSRGMMDRLARTLPKGWSADERFYGRRGSNAPDESGLVSIMNDGVSLIFHAGHGSDDSWEGCTSLGSLLPKLTNADRLPIVLSAGCSTARFATLPPYEPYVDVDGHEHKGSNFGEVFRAPPSPPAVYQRGKYNPSGLGEGLLRREANGAVAYIGCNTGSQPCGLTLLEGFSAALAKQGEPRLGDCWSGALAHYYDAEHLETIRPTADWYPASIFFQGMKFMLFGDPSLRMPAPGR
ncbi:MAG: Peptidase family [Planctomycetota bacterium]|nr:Peptidase family [Planctomycetota bacterium]